LSTSHQFKLHYTLLGIKISIWPKST